MIFLLIGNQRGRAPHPANRRSVWLTRAWSGWGEVGGFRAANRSP